MEKLPTEILELILDQIPNSALQATTKNLRKTLPKNNNNDLLLLQHQYKHLSITSQEELAQLIRAADEPDHQHLIRNHTQSISSLAWRYRDNNLLVNLLNLIAQSAQSLAVLRLRIGPLFAPEQLDELFLSHLPTLQFIDLRFNQNLSRRSYEPFLKGAYFDSSIDLISKWPETRTFRSLSFVQDPAPKQEEKAYSTNRGIAQPIILFRFWCLTKLSTSAIGRHLRHLRVRIPGRNVATAFLINPESSASDEPIQVGRQTCKLPRQPFPSLTFLDLSTTVLLPSSISASLVGALLRRLPSLTHLVVDRTQLLVPPRFLADIDRVNEDLQNLGSVVAAAGLSRANEAQKVWNGLYRSFEAELEALLVPPWQPQPPPPPPPSLNPSTSSSSTVINGSRRKGRSAYASAPRWKSSATTTTTQTSTSAGSPIAASPPNRCSNRSIRRTLIGQRMPDKVTILPALSNLTSLSCGTDLPTHDPFRDQNEQQEEEVGYEERTRNEWKRLFHGGWTSGCKKVEDAVRDRIQTHSTALLVWQNKLDKIRRPASGDSNRHIKTKTKMKNQKKEDAEKGKEKEKTTKAKSKSKSQAGKEDGRDSDSEDEDQDSEDSEEDSDEDSYEQIVQRCKANRPVLLIHETDALRANLVGVSRDTVKEEEEEEADGGLFGHFLRSQHLVEVTNTIDGRISAEQEEEMMVKIREKAGKPAGLCLMNDCEEVGQVVWGGPDPEDGSLRANLFDYNNPFNRPALPTRLLIRDKLPQSKEEVRHTDPVWTRFQNLSLAHLHGLQDGSELLSYYRPPAHSLAPHCAHLVARKIWDIDSW